MNKLFVFTVLFCFSLASCENDSAKEELGDGFLVIDFTNVSHLEIGNDVVCKGAKIGEVAKMELSADGQSIFVTSEIDPENKIPKGSKFYLASVDILGTKGIEVVHSNSTEYYTNKDTIVGHQQEIDSAYFQNFITLTNSLLATTDSLVKVGAINKDSLIDVISNHFDIK